MKTNFCVFLLLFASSLLLSGQESQYQRLINQGELPEDYTRPSYEKFKKSLIEKQIREGQKDEKQFYLESTFAIDELLRSGYILFNDPIGIYVNEVLDVIVQSNPELKKKKPRVYILRSTAVNAFAVDQGMIFVSIGLLSQLEDEAQLALILSHELVHVNENHNFDGFLVSTNVDRDLEEKRRVSTQQIDFANLEKNRYSRDQELEADEKGLTFFLNTNYSFKTIHRVFEVLRYAYLPFDEIPFEREYLEKISVSIPDDYLLEEVKSINPDEEDEEQSTHPALSTRTRLMSQRLNGMAVKGQKIFLVSEERFRNNQTKSRIELARLLMERQKLQEAIYTGFLIAKIYGVSEFTEEVIGESLYGLTKFKNGRATDNIYSPPTKEIEGESQQVYNIISELTKEELNVLAIAYNYDRYVRQPENEYLRELIIDLFADLYYYHDEKSLSGFFSIDTTSKAPDIEKTKELSKIDKIKSNRKKAIETSWHKMAFSDVLSDTLFRNLATEGFEAGKELKAIYDYYDDSSYRGRKNILSYEKEIARNGFSLGVDSVLLVNPVFFYLKDGMRKANPGYLESEERREAMKNIIQECAALNNVNIQTLDSKSLLKDETEKLNDIFTASEWISTQMDAEGFIYHAYNHKEIQAIAEKYETPYLMKVVVISVHQATALGRFLNNKTGSFMLVVLFDVRNGKRAYLKADFLPHYLNDAFLKSELYDAFHQISK